MSDPKPIEPPELTAKTQKLPAIHPRPKEDSPEFVAQQEEVRWMIAADAREHGTTHEAPLVRFDRDERQHLRALPARPLPVRERRLRRTVSHDCLVDVDTVRYSVPHALVRERVEVALGDIEVRVFYGGAEVARHVRSHEPFALVRDPAHFAGLWRPSTAPASSSKAPATPSPLAALGRTLDEYAVAVGGEA